MGIKTVIAVLFAVSITGSACMSTGNIQVISRPGEKIDLKGRLHLKNLSEDPLGIQDSLEHRLLKAGFEIRPEIFVKSSDGFVAKSRKAKSGVTEYSLEYEYGIRRIFLLRWVVVDSFSARMLNLETGKTVLDMKYRGRRSGSSFVNELVSKIEEAYK